MAASADRTYGGKRRLAALAALVLIAAAARIVFSIAVVGFHAPLKGDEADYHALAVSVAAGRGFATEHGEPTAGRAPLWPLALAAAYRLGGPRPETGRALSILLGALIVPLVYAAAKRALPACGGAALVAAALVAVNPALVFMSGYLLSENLSIVFMLLAIIAVSAGVREEGAPGAYLGAGLCLGLGSLARPTLFPVALCIAAALPAAGAGRRTARFARAALLLAGTAAVIAPWAVRNEIRLGAPVLFTTHGGITFYQGNNPLVRDIPSYRGGVAPIAALPGWDAILAKEGEIERDREAWRLGAAFIEENREAFPRMALWKFVRFWRFGGEMGLSGIRSGWWWNKGTTLGALASSLDVMFVYAVIAIPLFLAGLVLTARNARALCILHAIVIVHTVTALVFYGSLRSRAPVEPVIALFAAFALSRLFASARTAAGAAAGRSSHGPLPGHFGD